jgi:hypothetical protein
MGKKGPPKKLHPTAGKPSSPGKKSKGKGTPEKKASYPGKKTKGKGTPEKKGLDRTSKESLVTVEPIDVGELAYTQSKSSSAGPKPPIPAGEGLSDAVDN